MAITASIFTIPLVTVGVFIFFFLIGVMLWARQRRRQRTVFVRRPNIAMPMQPMNPQFQTSMLTQSIPYPNPYVANPMPVPQPMPIIRNPSTLPDAATSDLMDRMRQVQMLMVEIHRLESESGERNYQRIQELKQRVTELSNTDEHGYLVHVPTNTSLPPPPAYFPPEHGDTKARR